MKKIFSLLLLFALMFAPLPASAGGAPVSESSEGLADAELELFTVTLTLLDFETREGVSFLTVKTLEGETTLVLEAAKHCQFFDEGRRTLSPSDFGKRYKRRKITIDFAELEPGVYIVEECCSGTK
jgi:hypothetical protein